MSGKVLIVDDVATNRIVLRAKLRGARYDTVQAGTAAEALARIADSRPQLVLLDTNLPDMDGIALCQQIKNNPASADIAVIVLTSSPRSGQRIAALRAGASDFLSKPVDELVLLARMRSLLRARETDEELRQREATCRDLGFEEAAPATVTPARIVLIPDRPETGITWRTTLKAHLPGNRIQMIDRDSVLAVAASEPAPDAYVISANLGASGDGLRLMSELRSRHTSRHAAICIAVEQGARETSAVALDLGASDLLPLSLTPVEAAQEAAIRLQVQIERKRKQDRQRALVTDGLRLAATDPLTGLFNRRYAIPQLERMAENAEISGQAFAIMALDLDRFKSINDRWGHAAGDDVLVGVAERLEANLRGKDMIARMGGEEFLVAIPDTTLEDAQNTAQRLCHLIEERPFTLSNGTAIPVTVSIGLALGGTDGAQPPIEVLIDAADQALLGSKARGRNQVQLYHASKHGHHRRVFPPLRSALVS